MMCSKDYIERGENAVLHTYNRFPVVLERGEGVHLYDLEGKEYLDFGARNCRVSFLDMETRNIIRL